MKRVLAVLIMFVTAGFAQAYNPKDFVRDLKDDTRDYAFRYIGIGYYDHFHRDDREKVANFTMPVLAYKVIGVNPFMTFDGNTLEEFGASFSLFGLRRIDLLKGVDVTPYIFKNTEAEAIGLGISAVIKLR